MECRETSLKHQKLGHLGLPTLVLRKQLSCSLCPAGRIDLKDINVG